MSEAYDSLQKAIELVSTSVYTSAMARLKAYTQILEPFLVPKQDNVVDMISRGVCPPELAESVVYESSRMLGIPKCDYLICQISGLAPNAISLEVLGFGEYLKRLKALIQPSVLL